MINIKCGVTVLRIFMILIIFFMNSIMFQSTLQAKKKKHYKRTSRSHKTKKKPKKKTTKKKVEKKAEIIHEKLKVAIVKESKEVSIKIKNDKNISFVILHYASFALHDWNQKEMIKTNDKYTATIPSDYVLKKGLIYYIEAVDDEGLIVASIGSDEIPIFVETYTVKRATKKIEKKVKVSKNDELSLKEELAVFTMDNNVETVSQKVQKSKLAPAIVSVIPRSTILKTGAKNLIEILRYLPGVNISILPSGRYSVSIRGIGKNGNILMMINGNRINNPYDSSVIYDMSVDFIEKIEIIRGPGSSLFGTDAVVGVINIFTTRNDKSIRAVAGLHNNYEVSSNYSIKRRGLDINLSGGVALDDGANQFIERDDSSHMDWGLTTGDKEFESDRWSHKGYLSFNLSSDKLKLFIFVTENKRGTWVGPNYTATNGSSYTTDTILYNLIYSIIKSDKIKLSAKVYGNFFIVDNYLVTAPENYKSSISNEIFDLGKITKEKYNTMSIATELNLDWQIMKNLNILTGLSYQYLKILDYDLSRNYNNTTEEYHGKKFDLYDGTLLQQDGKSRYVLEYHLQGTYNYNDFGATLGLRFDYYNDFGLTINPRAGLVYNVMDIFIVKALYGQAFRAPTMKELYDVTDNNSNGILGNDKLTPEYVKTSEISIRFDLWKLNFNTNFFYNINENIIAPFDEDGKGGVGFYENIGETSDLGVEAEVKFFLNKYFNAFFNISWFQRKFTWSDEVWELDTPELDDRKSLITSVPMRNINMGFNFSFKDFGVFLGIRNESRVMNNNRMPLEEIHIVNIPEYWTVDVNVSYSITDNFLIYFSATDLGNPHYASPDEFGNNIAILGIDGLIQPKFNFRFGLTYRFDFE